MADTCADHVIYLYMLQAMADTPADHMIYFHMLQAMADTCALCRPHDIFPIVTGNGRYMCRPHDIFPFVTGNSGYMCRPREIFPIFPYILQAMADARADHVIHVQVPNLQIRDGQHGSIRLKSQRRKSWQISHTKSAICSQYRRTTQQNSPLQVWKRFFWFVGFVEGSVCQYY